VRKILCFAVFILTVTPVVRVHSQSSSFKVIGFFTAKNDQGHISFVREANKWFSQMGEKHNFKYDSTSNWSNLNLKFLRDYEVVVFLDTRPERSSQRSEFKKYMENGGGWIGFHFSGFALTPSSYPQNWDWYHTIFLGSGEYSSNTWRPTSAVLRVENKNHPVTENLPANFKSSPNEWYRWQNDLRKNPDIQILLAIDSTSFPLGTGPKQNEIWNSGYYPVVWTNKKYRMLYVNMGHNDIDYENKSYKTLSYTFSNVTQNQMILNGLLWLGVKK
jgi:hypothetical protein